MDRIIQDFRARSQLLVSQHEEEDEVVCTLSDTSESEDEADEEPERYKVFSNRPASWRHFTTTTRILVVFPFIFKFGNPSEV